MPMPKSRPVPLVNARQIIAVGGTIFEQVLASSFWTFLAFRMLDQKAVYLLPPIAAMGLYFTSRNLKQRLGLLKEQNFEHLDTAKDCRHHRDYLANVELEHARDKIHQWKAFCTFGGMIMGGLSYIATSLGPTVDLQLGGLKVPSLALAAGTTLIYMIICAIRWNHHIKTGKTMRQRVHLLDLRLEELEAAEGRRPGKGPGGRAKATMPPVEREPAAAAEVEED